MNTGRCHASLLVAHGYGRSIWLVSITVNTGGLPVWLGPTLPQVVIQSRAFMDDFGSLVYTEPFR